MFVIVKVRGEGDSNIFCRFDILQDDVMETILKMYCLFFCV